MVERMVRLEKLENAVFGRCDGRSSLPTTSMPLSQKPLSPAIIPNSIVNEEHRTASKWLEGIGTHGDSMVSLLVN